MKKLLSLILALMMILSLTACTVTVENDAEKPAEEKVEKEEAAEEKDVAEDEDNAAEEEEKDVEKEDSKEDKDPVEVKEGEVLLIDNKECTIKVTYIDPDYDYGYKLDVNMENKTDDKTLYYTLESAAIDGLNVSASLGEKISAGKKANDEIVFYKENYENAGGLDFSDIRLALKVYDYDNYSDVSAEEIVHIYPAGEDEAVTYERKEKKSDEVLIDDEDLKVTLIDFDEDDYYVFANVYVENNSDEQVTFSSKDVSVNGYMMSSTSFYADFLPDTTGYKKIQWSKDSLEENDIKTVEDVEITLYARAEGSYENIVEETFEIEA